MTLVNLLRKAYESEIFGKPLRYVSRRYGENIYNRDWDVLLIFDAAQYKIVDDIKDQYEFIDNVSRLKSRGSNSPEWAQNTFITDFDMYEGEIKKTHYITDNLLTSFVLSGLDEKEFYHRDFDNPWIKEYIDKVREDTPSGCSSHLKGFHPVWMTSKRGFNAENRSRPPEIITQKTKTVIDNSNDTDRVISHYMMPHEPFVNSESRETSGWPHRYDGRSMFNMNEQYYDDLIHNYRQNHNYIFNHIKSLLSEIPNDKKVVITSDHANITNKIFGIPYTFGHPQYITFSKQLRCVPWIEVDQSGVEDLEATESQDYTQDYEIDTDEVEDRLESLGYIS